MSYQDPSQPPYGQPPSYGQQPYGQPQYPQQPQQPQQPQYPPPPPPGYGQPMYGQPAPAYGAPGMPMQVAQPNGLALASLISGILSLTLCGTVAAVVAVITGHMGLNRAKTLPPELARRGMAMAGLIMGYISIGITVIVIIFYIIAIAAAANNPPPSSFLHLLVMR